MTPQPPTLREAAKGAANEMRSWLKNHEADRQHSAPCCDYRRSIEELEAALAREEKETPKVERVVLRRYAVPMSQGFYVADEHQGGYEGPKGGVWTVVAERPLPPPPEIKPKSRAEKVAEMLECGAEDLRLYDRPKGEGIYTGLMEEAAQLLREVAMKEGG